MPRGGKRAGAGRKVNALTKTSREAAVDATNRVGITPIEVMASNLKFWAETATNSTKRIEQILEDAGIEAFREDPELWKQLNQNLKNMLFARDKAQECAVDMAPYRHPRLANIEMTGGFKEAEEGPPKITSQLSPKDAAARYEALLTGNGG